MVILLKQILRRHDFSATTLKFRLKRVAVILFLLSSLHVIAMMAFEGLTFWNSSWLTATTLVTVGYGDTSPVTFWGQLSTIVLLYGMGIYAAAHMADIYLTLKQQRHDQIKNGKWRWKLDNHILIIGAPRFHAEKYFDRLMEQFRKSDRFKEHNIQLMLEDQESLKASQETIERHQAVSYVGNLNDDQSLKATDADKAEVVIVLAKDDRDADACTFDLISRIREMNREAIIIAEAVDDNNTDRFQRAGATSVIRPMRSYPEMVVRAIVAPGSEAVITNLFSSHGDECKRFDVNYSEPVKWKTVITRAINHDLGIPLGYIAENGQVITNPSSNDNSKMKAILIMVKDSRQVDPLEIQTLVAPGL